MTTKAISADTPPLKTEDKYDPDLLKFYIGGKDTLTSSDLQNKNEITIYEGQPHAFVTDMESIRSGCVQEQAWTQLLQFLDKNLKQEASTPEPTKKTSYSPPFNWNYYLVLAYEHAFGMGRHGH